MPYAKQPANCHPERQRKTADGLCEACYQKRRYHTEPHVRTMKITRSLARYHKVLAPGSPSERPCFECGETYRPQTDHSGNRFCSDACRYRAWARHRRGVLAQTESEEYRPLDVLKRDNGRCQLCGGTIDTDLKYPHPLSLSIDHVVPLVHGGDDKWANVQAAHLRCNIAKGARAPEGQLRLVV